MKSVARIDRSNMQKAQRTPEGYLRAPAYATRTGVFVYRKADGSTIRELRLPEEVFHPESLASLAGKPVTVDHPDVVMLDASNAHDYMAGFTGDEVVQDGDHVRTTVTITRASAIADVDAGKAELSCGYTCELEERGGIHNGERYDCIQRNIRHNHLAIVNAGRAGRTARLRLDDAMQVIGDESDNGHGEAKTMKVTIDGKEFEVAEDLGAAINALQAKPRGDSESLKAITTLQSKLDTAQAKADQAAADLQKVKDELKAKADAADPAAIRKAARARVELERVAAKVLPEADVARLDTLDDRAVKEAVIKADSAGADLTGKSDDYVQARFDAVVETLKEREDAEGETRETGKAVHKTRSDASMSPSDKVEAARKKQLEDARNAWKTKTA